MTSLALVLERLVTIGQDVKSLRSFNRSEPRPDHSYESLNMLPISDSVCIDRLPNSIHSFGSLWTSDTAEISCFEHPVEGVSIYLVNTDNCISFIPSCEDRATFSVVKACYPGQVFSFHVSTITGKSAA